MAGLAPAEIRALARVIDELDYYQLLEITPEATASDVKRAYHSTTRRFHPDANRHLDGELRISLELIARRLAEAYCVVRDPRRRRAYDQRIAKGQPDVRMQLSEATAVADRSDQEERTGATPKGRRLFMEARSDVERGDLAAAARNLQMALTFEPQNELFQRELQAIREKLRAG